VQRHTMKKSPEDTLSPASESPSIYARNVGAEMVGQGNRIATTGVPHISLALPGRDGRRQWAEATRNTREFVMRCSLFHRFLGPVAASALLAGCATQGGQAPTSTFGYRGRTGIRRGLTHGREGWPDQRDADVSRARMLRAKSSSVSVTGASTTSRREDAR